MKYPFIYLILMILLNSCTVHHCATRLVNFKLYPVIDNETAESSTFIGWYHSEFQSSKLNFAFEFITHDDCGEFYDQLKEYYWGNYLVEDSIKITCNYDITNNIDTLKSGENLIKCFDIIQYDYPGDFPYMSILLSEKETNNYQFKEKYFSFKVSLTTSDSINMIDSCIIKRY